LKSDETAAWHGNPAGVWPANPARGKGKATPVSRYDEKDCRNLIEAIEKQNDGNFAGEQTSLLERQRRAGKNSEPGRSGGGFRSKMWWHGNVGPSASPAMRGETLQNECKRGSGGPGGKNNRTVASSQIEKSGCDEES